MPASSSNASTHQSRSGEVLVTRSGVSDDLAYQMTKLMFDNLDRLVTAHAAAKAISLDKAPKNLPLPLHPGAERFYKEKGLLP